ncbi:MAG: crotonase/enoyl-CoA hydratase family protein [Gammaproteobacteria bacterium]|nr:MAG: crotonase/enoyl-CoA hydratase family protein [Gammaproteobacteria bacterium]RLA19263.1 MAG: crotonase/enoyl-CoA hydratase family protein [Gammaproteobacteria bacterium]
MSQYETITLEIESRGVARLTLNRPDLHNAMNAQLISEMQQALALVESSDEVRVVVLTGAGSTFCAGGDLNWMKSNITKTRAQRVEETGELANMLAALNNLSKPLIGRVQGLAYGGGVGMVSVCDIAIGVSTATFGLTEVKLGLTPATISPYVVKRIGAANARRNFFNSRIFNAEEAQRIGLLTEAVEAEKLDEAVEKEIKMILKCAPGAIASTKKLIDYVDTHSAPDNRIYTAANLADAWETAEGQEGIDAFLNKRKANWIN